MATDITNIEYFTTDSYKDKYSVNLKNIESSFTSLDKELAQYQKEADETGYSAISFLGTVGAGTASGAAIGSVFGPVGSIFGGFVGLLGGIFTGVSQGQQAEIADTQQINAIQQIRENLKTRSRVFSTKLAASRQRFQNIFAQREATANYYRNQTALKHAQLNDAIETLNIDYRKGLGELGLKQRLTGGRLDNTVDAIYRNKEIYSLKKESLIERYQLEKQSFDDGLNILSTKYHLASLAKDMRAVEIAQTKQQQFLQTVTPVTQGAAAGLQQLQTSSRTLEQISNSISVMNAIEQKEAQTLLIYRDAVTKLDQQTRSLKLNKTYAQSNFRVKLKELTAGAAGIIAELDNQVSAYKLQLENLASQRVLLNQSYDSRHASLLGRQSLIDQELQVSLSRLEASVGNQLTNEAERYGLLLEEQKALGREARFRTLQIVNTDELGEIQTNLRAYEQFQRQLVGLTNQRRQNINIPINPGLLGPRAPQQSSLFDINRGLV